MEGTGLRLSGLAGLAEKQLKKVMRSAFCLSRKGSLLFCLYLVLITLAHNRRLNPDQ